MNPRSLLLATMLALCAGPLCAEEQPAAEPQSELGKVQQEITLSADQQARIAAEMQEAQADQDAISKKLVGIARTIAGHEEAIGKAEAKIVKLKKQEVVIRSDLAAQQEKLSALLAGLQRLEQNPPPALVVEPKDVLAALRGAMMFGAIVPGMRKDAESLAARLSELEGIRVALESERGKMTGDIADLQASRTELGGLAEMKTKLLAEQGARLEQEKTRARELAARAQDLQQLIDQLAAARRKEEEEQAKKLAAAEAAAAAERQRQAEIAARPRIAFSKLLGQLATPAQGQILRRFGDGDGLGSKLRGFAIATRPEAQVTAPADGRVEFSGPFRSYGQLLIIDVGEGHLILLAGMERIAVDMGAVVRAGEPVAQMGKGPSSVTLLGDMMQEKRPVLYVELRKGGEAIDSAQWWIGGMKEASR
jgi:septal ring factor EnvC (AmiA/AmiB activator)